MGTWTYSYDNLNRLTGAEGLASSTAGVSNNYAGAQANWSYDPFGNRETANWSGNPNNGTPTATFPAASNVFYTTGTNQAVSSILTYDASGNVIYDAVTKNSYLYDAESRLCAVYSPGNGYTGYFYDAAGTRVAKGALANFSCNFAANGFTPTTSYVLGLKGEQITELSVSGAQGSYVSAWKHANVFDGLGLAATYSLTGSSSAPTSTYFALNDWLGTKRAEVGYVVGTNGAQQPCTATFASLPYGDGLSANGNCPDATEHHFTGKERDAESGNDYFGARYYASSMGRWMSPDTDFNLKRILPNPQKWNRYAYVLNNPLILIDADGRVEIYVFLPQANSWSSAWKQVAANALAHGNHVTPLVGDEKATRQAYVNALKTPDAMVVFVGHTLDVMSDSLGRNQAQSVYFPDSETVGKVHDGIAPNSPTPDNIAAQNVAVFGCNSADLADQYSSTDFVGAMGTVSGSYFETGAAAYTDVLASDGTVSDAVSASQNAMNQEQSNFLPYPDGTPVEPPPTMKENPQ